MIKQSNLNGAASRHLDRRVTRHFNPEVISRWMILPSPNILSRLLLDERQLCVYTHTIHKGSKRQDLLLCVASKAAQQAALPTVYNGTQVRAGPHVEDIGTVTTPFGQCLPSP
eukprot:1142260-Pelagomonas_calceolata.AAC.13